MSAFPDDVIADILSRLHVKPLLRFRCVCKPWLDLIDSPVFIKLHLNKTKKLESHRKLIQQGSALDIYTVDFDSIAKTNIADVVAVPDPFGPVVIIRCCNGLVCVSKAGGHGLAIWNPSTRRHQILPDLEIGPLPNTSNHGSGCRWVCGFGYDVLGDDYKVLVMKQTDSVFERSHSLLKIIPQPNYPSKVDFYLMLKTLGGCLSLMWQCGAGYIDVWVLKEYGKQDSWTKITRIEASAFGDSILGFTRKRVNPGKYLESGSLPYTCSFFVRDKFLSHGFKLVL
ncbi:hypothetical protein LIER_34068 [Lithospermum erythrorhizon]|uniref:F-box domain-containing protein n=1 Tax=Lithospermum erythrorhizon TaxID=34254 RepID=A0AAV3S1K5_LITER